MEASSNGGDHFGEVGRERVAVKVGKESQEIDAFPANRRLGGGIRVVNAVEERGEGVVVQCLSDGLELGGGKGESVAVGELVEAGNDPALEIVGG